MSAETRRGSGLGKGLAALIPTAPSGVSGNREVAVSSIRPNPKQPRRIFDAEELQRLAESIAAHGVLQPVVLVERHEGFTLIAGERRWRAASLLKLETIPAIVRSANEQEQLELALVENIQRSDLNAVDEARAYRNLIDEFGLTQERVAERVGRSRPAVANTLRILDTAPGVQQAVSDSTISGGHARALASWRVIRSRRWCWQQSWRGHCRCVRPRALWQLPGTAGIRRRLGASSASTPMSSTWRPRCEKHWAPR